MLTEPEVQQTLQLFAEDITRKPSSTRKYYMSIARKFLTEYGDFSRHGIMAFMNNSGWCDNSLRTSYYVIEHLCMAIGLPFPLNKNDLPPPPDEYDLYTPTLTGSEVTQLIRYWREYPGSYPTSLLYLSTMYSVRAIEMTDVILNDKSVVIHVAKKKRPTYREHPVWGQGLIYLSGYERLSEKTVNQTFWKVCKKAGVKRQEDEGWHAVRRAFATVAHDNGVDSVLVKRYTHWAVNRDDMMSVYYHKPFEEINREMEKVHPFLNLW